MAKSDADLRPRVGDYVTVWIGLDAPVPDGWTRNGCAPICWRIWTGEEDAELPGRLIGIARSAGPKVSY